MKADLHCHSSLSDGTVHISDLIPLAKKQGLNVLAVTDHDTMAGCHAAAIIGKQYGMTILPGAEISARDMQRNRKVHILCYGRADLSLRRMLKKTRDSRRAAMAESVKKVMKQFPIPLEMILEKAKSSENIFKQHVMAALVDAGYADGIFGETFQTLFHSKTGCAFEPVQYPDVYEVLQAVRRSNCVAVLAHPGEYDSLALMEELCRKNLIDGLEQHHPRNTETVKAQIAACANLYGKFCTGGTDFHGAFTKTPLPVGSYLTEPAQFAEFIKNMR